MSSPTQALAWAVTPASAAAQVRMYFLTIGPLGTAGFVGSLNTVAMESTTRATCFSAPAPKTLNTQHCQAGLHPEQPSSTSSSAATCKRTQATCQPPRFLPWSGKSKYVRGRELARPAVCILVRRQYQGLAVGYTWTPTSNIVNDLRYGFIRQGYSTRGIGSGQPGLGGLPLYRPTHCACPHHRGKCSGPKHHRHPDLDERGHIR